MGEGRGCIPSFPPGGKERPPVHPALVEPPASRAPPWEARSCLQSTPTAVHTLPLRGGPYTPGAPPRRRASPWLCSDPILSLEDGRPAALCPRLVPGPPGFLRPLR